MIYFTMYGPTLLRKDMIDKIGPKGEHGQPLPLLHRAGNRSRRPAAGLPALA